MAAANSRADRIARWCFRHWLLIMNGGVLLYTGLALLAPVLTALGYTRLGGLLFAIYTPFCHQIPARSYGILGHQVAICHREVAMYATTIAGGLIYGATERGIPPLSGKLTLLLLLPMLLDGGTHAIDDALGLGLRAGGDAVGSLNWWLRLITGILFGLAVTLGIYPRFERDLRRPLLATAL